MNDFHDFSSTNENMIRKQTHPTPYYCRIRKKIIKYIKKKLITSYILEKYAYHNHSILLALLSKNPNFSLKIKRHTDHILNL